MVVVVRSYWPQSLYCQMDKTGDCGRTSPQRNIQSLCGLCKIHLFHSSNNVIPVCVARDSISRSNLCLSVQLYTPFSLNFPFILH